MPVKEFIFSKVGGLQPATLQKNELLHRYFSRLLATLQEHLFQEQLWTAASEFLVKGISEHPVISFITHFNTLKPWNEINEDIILMDREKKHISVIRIETDLLQNVQDKQECYHNLLGGLAF